MRVVFLIVSGICNLEILDLKPWHVIHWDLEVHWQRTDFFSALRSCRVLQCNLSNQIMLYTTLEFFYSPLSVLISRFVFVWLPLNTFRKFKGDVGCWSWHRELDNNLSSKMVLRKLCSDLNRKCELVLRYLINERIESERCRVFSIDTIVHDQEFSVWWVDSYCFHCFKITDIHTLMKIAIIKNNTPDLTSCWLPNLQVII